ncbi:SulP family inorganic anion transporter [Consotaella salsifontis]|uniref:Sulfate permease, SulP family n=1 Tax=Consotaella salsifontis TaxID=1365950 RepID=A0A1T4NI45_9HYPH|nr:SulP family inorganic anion transporter [Consotaella salsifontis]SJZ78884.1 sulfate permease, SulP family [Consotaella salsifontis]
MTTLPTSVSGRSSAGLLDLFTPKLVTVLREGYGLKDLKADAIAGLTVAIVALPLSMAIAIASGASPERGLYTAIVGGFFVSALGGSRFQIGGPAGAFIVLVASTIQRQGFDGFLLAAMLSGFILLALGLMRLGSYIKFIPYPVTVGFTAGIAVIIFSSQIKDLLGLHLTVPEPGEFIAKIEVLASSIGSISPAATGIAILSVAIIVGLKRIAPAFPGMLLAVGVAALLTFALDLPIDTIGSKFGGIPRTLPSPALPPISLDKVIAVLPDAVAFALLGSIESLLSAVVADGMTGRRHRSNCELAAQGLANIASPLFGGLCVTGTIARTATNVRTGARGPISGILHALFLFLFMLIAAPLASAIPLAALAAVLAVVSWNMAERHAFALLLRSSRGDAVVLLATFLLTVFRDLTTSIVVGVSIGAMLFIHRMAETTGIEAHTPPVLEDASDRRPGRVPYEAMTATRRDIVIYRISGAFFFGAVANIGSVLDRIGDNYRTLIIDFSAVPFLDSSAANSIGLVARRAANAGRHLIITGASSTVRRVLLTHGVRSPHVTYRSSVEAALERAAPEEPTSV